MAKDFMVTWEMEDILRAVGELYLATKSQQKAIALLDARRLELERQAEAPAPLPAEA